MPEKLNSGNWRVRYRRNGKRFSETFPNKELATKFEASLTLDRVEHLVDCEVDDVNFTEFAERWLSEYCELEKAESQWKEDRSVIKTHLLPAFAMANLADLKKGDLNELKLKLQKATKPGKKKSSYKPKTINNIIGLAKKMMSTAVEWELIPRNPFQEVKKLKIKDQDFDFWMPDERDVFLEACYKDDPDFADAVLVACHTGLRLGELAGLTWSAIDFNRKMFSVKNTFSYKLKKGFNRTKTHDKTVLLPLNDIVFATLVKRRASSKEEAIFPKELLAEACKKLKRRSRKYGIRAIRFHDLRHTFASCLAMAGVDLMIIKELMRHRSYQMTLRYAHLHPDHLRGATDVLVSRGPGVAHGEKSNFSAGPRLAHENEKGKVILFPSVR